MTRKIRLMSKFMTSQAGKKIIATQILLNISRSKGNRAMKFGQSIEYNARNIFFFNNYGENETGRLVPELFSFFKKALSKVNTRSHHLSLKIFW